MLHSQPDGFLAVPPTGSGAGVLVLHPWWGLNDTMRSVCARLAESGFIAFAVALYHGQVADNIADVGTLSSRLDGDRAMADIAEAATFLRQRALPTERGLAVIGFSLGPTSRWAFRSPTRSASVRWCSSTGPGPEIIANPGQNISGILPRRMRMGLSPESTRWRGTYGTPDVL